MTRHVGRYGRRTPKRAPAIRFAQIMTGTVPAHPTAADYLSRITGWGMLGNDRYGDCVAVALANMRKVITTEIGSTPYEPTIDEVLAFYKTQNPGFPGEDGGMDEQTALEELLAHGDEYYDRVKPLAFASVDVQNPGELDAAVSIFGPSLLGINVTDTNEQEFSRGEEWSYDPYGRVVGGHAVIEGGYSESDETGEFETWAQVTRYTDEFRRRQLEEFWVVIWPEHLGTQAFQEGVDLAALASAYQALTGRAWPGVLPGPQPEPTPTPSPVPSDADAALALAQQQWEDHEDNMKRRRSCDSVLEEANRAWRQAKGL